LHAGYFEPRSVCVQVCVCRANTLCLCAGLCVCVCVSLTRCSGGFTHHTPNQLLSGFCSASVRRVSRCVCVCLLTCLLGDLMFTCQCQPPHRNSCTCTHSHVFCFTKPRLLNPTGNNATVQTLHF